VPQNFLYPQRDQPLLLPVDMREWLPEDDLVYVVLDACPGPACRGAGSPSEAKGGCQGGEGLVAEFGQNMAGLPDDLAGFGQGGALAVLAVLHLGVVAVVGGGGAGVGLAGLIHRPAQYRRSLPGQPPGQTLAVRRPDGDVQPGEPDRFAGGREPVCPAQPSRSAPTR
jgi:hypothetical protein